MVLLAAAALWATICVSFAVFAGIVGMPFGTIAQTLAVASLNFGAILGAISVIVLVRRQLNEHADETHAPPSIG